MRQRLEQGQAIDLTQGLPAGALSTLCKAHLKYEGTDTALAVSFGSAFKRLSSKKSAYPVRITALSTQAGPQSCRQYARIHGFYQEIVGARGKQPGKDRLLAAGDLGLANNIGIYPDGRYSYQLTIYIFRYGEGTVMAIMHPNNPVAQKSVTRYMEAMRSVCTRVADSGHWGRVA